MQIRFVEFSNTHFECKCWTAFSLELESTFALQTEEVAKKAGKSAEEITEKYGLEAGLWNVFRSKDKNGRSKGDLAKDLLKRYGSAYLITSISFALVSFSLCYALVSAGKSLIFEGSDTSKDLPQTTSSFCWASCVLMFNGFVNSSFDSSSSFLHQCIKTSDSLIATCQFYELVACTIHGFQ